MSQTHDHDRRRDHELLEALRKIHHALERIERLLEAGLNPPGAKTRSRPAGPAK